MIIKSNKNVYKNYFGEGGISKVYAGENLVFGQDSSDPVQVKNYMALTCNAPNGGTISMIQTTSQTPVSLSYSTDGTTWTTWLYTSQTENDSTIHTFNNINVNNGDRVYFKGNNSTGLGSGNGQDNAQFVLTGSMAGSGNTMSLLYGDNFENENNAPDHCFDKLFKNCSSLTTAAELPATSLGVGCYNQMFAGCSNLTTAPALPATVLTNGKNPANACYMAMFSKCSSLTTAPVLPATGLIDHCYYEMFYGCSSLNYVKAMFTNTLYSGINYWLQGVSSTGTFVMNADATWDPEEYRGTSGIPEGWTVEKVTA